MKKTPRVESILARAEEIAAEHGHDYLGTEHLMLALAEDRDGIAGQVIANIGASEAVRDRIEAILASDGYNQRSP